MYLSRNYKKYKSIHIPQAPINDDARRNNQNLPGMGGVFNHINSNLYAYAANNPVHYIDPDGRKILLSNSYFNMSDYFTTNLGNSSSIKISQEGCYITCFANILKTAFDIYEKSYVNLSYNTPKGINNNKSLFNKDSAELNGRTKSMNSIFGEGNWDYWTAKGQGGDDKLLQKLKEYSQDIDGYMVVGIFDLSKAEQDVQNHMVLINGMPNDDGIFENIGITSNGDIRRLADQTKANEYNIKNLKEFRVIKVTDFYKCTQGE